MCRTAQAILDESDVELQLPGVSGLELTGLELDDGIPQLLDVEEQQVSIEVLATDVEVDLPSHEGESWAELPQRVDDPVGQRLLESPFGDLAGQIQKIKDQRVLGDLLGELGIVRNKLLRDWLRGPGAGDAHLNCQGRMEVGSDRRSARSGSVS